MINSIILDKPIDRQGSEKMSKVYKILLALVILFAAFIFGFAFGFGYIGDSPIQAFDPNTWRTFLEQLRTF